MHLKKRDCGIKMKIVPYGAGWTGVYMDFGAEELYFIISHCLENNLTDFMRLLYHMFPQHDDPEQCYEGIEYKYAVNRNTEDGYKTERIVDNLKEIGLFMVYHEVPWKVSFEWNEEGACSIWSLEENLMRPQSLCYISI